MKLMEEEKRKKLMELPEVDCTTNPTLVIYTRVDITPELKEKIDAIMDGIGYMLIKKVDGVRD